MKLLALEPTHSLHRERLMGSLWPDLGPEAAGANLRKAVHFARRAMGAEEAIRSAGPTLSLWGGNVEVDAQTFLAIADAALGAGDAEACAAAVARYRGDLVPADQYESWAAEPRARWHRRYVDVLKGAGRWERVVELDPTDEEAHRALILRYYGEGRRREAIRQFEQLRDALREHIGVGPDAETIALYERVLDMEGAEPPTDSQRVAGLVATGLVHLNRGEFPEAERLARQALAIAVDARLGHELGDAATLLALVSSLAGRWTETFRGEFIAMLGLDVGLLFEAWDANLCFAAYYLSGSESPDRFIAYARELLDLAVAAGSVPGRSIAQLLIGEAVLSSGDFASARTELVEALALATAAGSDCVPCLARERLARVELAVGDREAARRHLDAALPTARRSRLRSHLLVRLLGVGVLVPSEPGQALVAVAQAERQLAGTGKVCDPCSIDFRLQAAVACARAGELSRARRHLAAAERIAGMWPGGPWAAGVWEARAELRLAEGERGQALAFLREAAEGFGAAQRPVDERRCRTAAASLALA
ncbi:MAG TPA: BTAD domain-containing putative transcriptional regulator [Actinomycetota bacterium]|nr:BTAD domain-containing putative transcriptional regulator [Actinomycetota bacterium]